MDWNQRDHRRQVSLPWQVEFFYWATAEFCFDNSVTDTLQRFLINRSQQQENIDALVSAITSEAIAQQKAPRELIAERIREKYKNFSRLSADAEVIADALCSAWGIN